MSEHNALIRESDDKVEQYTNNLRRQFDRMLARTERHLEEEYNHHARELRNTIRRKSHRSHRR